MSEKEKALFLNIRYFFVLVPLKLIRSNLKKKNYIYIEKNTKYARKKELS